MSTLTVFLPAAFSCTAYRCLKEGDSHLRYFAVVYLMDSSCSACPPLSVFCFCLSLVFHCSCLCVCLTVSQPIYLSVSQTVSQSVSLFCVFLSVSVTFLSVCHSLLLSLSLFLSLSPYLSPLNLFSSDKSGDGVSFLLHSCFPSS